MTQNLDKLDEEDLFVWLSQKVNAETASAIKENGISGASLLGLDDDELKEILPKVGHRKAVKTLLADFKGDTSPERKVRYLHEYAVHSKFLHVIHSDATFGPYDASYLYKL